MFDFKFLCSLFLNPKCDIIRINYETFEKNTFTNITDIRFKYKDEWLNINELFVHLYINYLNITFNKIEYEKEDVIKIDHANIVPDSRKYKYCVNLSYHFS